MIIYTGSIFDQSTQLPIPGVNIQPLENLENIYTISDYKGNFTFQYSSKTSLTFHKLGYDKYTYDFNIPFQTDKFYLIPTTESSPNQIEKQRAKDQHDRTLNIETNNDVIPSVTNIDNATSSLLKPIGAAALQAKVLKQGKILLITILPAIIALASQAGMSALKSLSPQSPELCPTDLTLKKLIKKRNDIVNMLNKVATSLNIATAALTSVSITLNIINTLFSILGVAIPTAEYALASTVPATPGFPVVALFKLKDILKDNQPKLDKFKFIIDGTSLALSLISLTIVVIIGILKALDLFLSKCQLNADLTPIASNLIIIAEQQLKASQTPENVTYKGFTIKTETIPYTPTVNRYKAIGINSDGIKLIETSLSFTENKQTLIDELKFTIDKDNLKAN